MPRIIGQFNNKNYKSNKFNNKKALAIFLIGQAFTGSVWGVQNIAGSSVTQIGGDSQPYVIIAGTGGSFTNSSNVAYADSASNAALLTAQPGVNTLGNYTINLVGFVTTLASGHPVIDMRSAAAPGTINITNGYGGGVSRVYCGTGTPPSQTGPVGGVTVIDFTGATAKLNLVQNDTGGFGNYIYGNILGSNSGDNVTLNGGDINGNIVFGNGANQLTIALANSAHINGNIIGGSGGDTIALHDGAVNGNIVFGNGANQLTIDGSAHINGAGVAITGGAGGNTININGTATVSGHAGNYAINIPSGSGGSSSVLPSTINITGTPTITGGINATAVKNTLNVGTGATGTTYNTSGDIINMQTVNIVAPPAVTTTTFTINNNITGVTSFNNSLNSTSHVSATGSIVGGSSSGSSSTAALTNNGTLLVDTGGAISGLTIANNKEITTAGTINAPITFGTTGGTLTINGGSIAQKITGGAGTNKINVGGTFVTSADIDKIDTFNINAGGNLTINNKVTGVSTSFTTAATTISTIVAGGDLSGGGIITNAGTITVDGNGTIGATDAMGNVTNTGTINSGGGNVKVGTFTNNLAGAILNITQAVMQTGNINNTLGVIRIGNNGTAGDLSSINPASPSTLINAPDQTITVGGTGSIGATNALGAVTNKGIINASGGNIKIGTFTNNQAADPLAVPAVVNIAQLNITNGSSVQTGNINNTLGKINIATDGTFGDLSGVLPNTTTLTNAAGQVITVGGTGTIGATNALGAVTNLGTINAGGGSIKIGDFTNDLVAAQLKITSGSVQTGNINNTLGSITIGVDAVAVPPTSALGGDLSSLDAGTPSTLTNAAGQTITVAGIGTIGATNPLGAVTNYGIINLGGGNIKTGAFSNNSVNAEINIYNGSSLQAGDINNILGTINIGHAVKGAGDLSSLDPNHPSTFINAPTNTINVVAHSSIGGVNPLGTVTNYGVIHAQGGNINVGDFTNDNALSANLNIDSGSVVQVKSLNNTLGIVTIGGDATHQSDLSSAVGTQATLNNALGQTITVSNYGSIGKNYPFGVITNNGILDVQSGSTVNATSIMHSGDMMTVAGSANAPITFGNIDSILNIIGGKTQAITGATSTGSATSTINITGPFATNGDIQNVNAINLNANNFTINDNVTGATTQFTTAVGTTINIRDHGDLSAGNGINNLGTIILTKTATGGTIGANVATGNVNNSGIITASGGNISVGTFTNNLAGSQLNISSGQVGVSALVNTIGSVTISGGDLSASAALSSGTLTNAANQIITISKTGTIGAVNPFATATNSGIINVQDTAIVKIGNFTNKSLRNNNHLPVALNITGGSVLAGSITNTNGNITIGSTVDHSGDLSSADPSSPSELTNAANQTITLSGTGTIGNTAALGLITNNGIINAGGGNIIVGEINNGDSVNNHKASLNITQGIVQAENINNNLGTISVFSTTDGLGNIYLGDLSSADPVNPSVLTNAANQIITVATGTLGANNPLGVVNNNGIMNIDNNITVGAINLGTTIGGTVTAATGTLNLTGGIAKTGNITNKLGKIIIGNNGGQMVDLSSVDQLNPSTITNAPLQTITLIGAATIGANGTLGAVSNSGIINLGGGNVAIGDFNNSGSSAAKLNITSGNVVAGNITNTIGKIIIQGGDLSSVDSTNHSVLTNSSNQTITVSGTGTIGNLANSAIGNVDNSGIFQAHGGNITVDSFNNGAGSNIASLDIQSGIMKVGISINNTNGSITIGGGDLSGVVANSTTLTNAANQIININGTGTIGANNSLGAVNNTGTINAMGGNVKIGDFTNNLSTAVLSITKGNIQTSNINNTLGAINILGGDLSGIAANTSTLTNPTNQKITVSANGTIGATNQLGLIVNDGTITATTNIFKAGALNNTTNGIVNIVNNNLAGTSGGIVIKGIHNSGQLNIYNLNNNTTAITDINIGKFHNLAGGIFNINGKLTALGNCINDTNATTNIQADFNIGAGNTFTNNGTVNVLLPTTIQNGNYTVGTTATHLMTIENGVASTLTLSHGTASLASGSTININIVDDSLLQDRQQLQIIATNNPLVVAANASNIINSINIVGTTGLLSYQLSKSGNNLIATVSRQSIAGIVDGPNNNTTTATTSTLAENIDSIINSGQINDPMIRLAAARLEKLSPEAITDAVNQLSPDTDIAAITLATNGVVVPEVIAQRIEVLARAGIKNLRTGYAAGSMQIDDGLWIKGLGGSIEQKKRAGNSGYNANTVGVAFGADTRILTNTWVGLGLSSVGTHMKSKDYPAKKTNVSSYQVTVYGSFSPDNYYIDALGSMAFNNYKTARNIQYINQTATATFTGVQPSTKISAGYNLYQKNGLKIIPNASLQYSTLYQNPYSEVGAGGVGLQKVSSTNLSQLEVGAGIKLAILENEYADQVYNPDIHFMVLHDLKASAQETTAQFIGGGGSFKVQSATPDKTTYNIGAGMVFMHKNRLHFTANYELRKKNKFIGHSGSLAVRYEI